MTYIRVASVASTINEFTVHSFRAYQLILSYIHLFISYAETVTEELAPSMPASAFCFSSASTMQQQRATFLVICCRLSLGTINFLYFRYPETFEQ